MDRPSDLAADAVGVPDARPLSFEELFAAEHERLFRAMYLITGSSDDAEEAMQDAFLRVWERWDRVSTLENPAAYLTRTAVNSARSRYRRITRAARRTLTPGQPEDEFAVADLRDALVRALKTLAPRQRTALVLTDLLGYSSDEAADMLHVKAVTVRSLSSQARGALRDAMEDRDG